MNKLSVIKKLESGNDIIISALGDSLTEGWMVNKGYIEFLEEMIASKFKNSKFKIINCGVSGDTAQGGFSRIKDCAGKNKPDLFIVEFGLNDAFIGHSVEKFKRNIMQIVKTIKENYKSEIILITSVPMSDEEENEIMNRFYRSIEEVSKEEDTFFAAPHLLFTSKLRSGVSRSELFLSDLVHPSVEGYKLIAESIMKLF